MHREILLLLLSPLLLDLDMAKIRPVSLVAALLLLMVLTVVTVRSEARVLYTKNEAVFKVRGEGEVFYRGKKIWWSADKATDSGKRLSPGGPDPAHHGEPPMSR